jgi:hypothetical protein
MLGRNIDRILKWSKQGIKVSFISDKLNIQFVLSFGSGSDADFVIFSET